MNPTYKQIAIAAAISFAAIGVLFPIGFSLSSPYGTGRLSLMPSWIVLSMNTEKTTK